MQKIDYKKEFKSLYTASNKPVIVSVPKMNFLMIDGMGDPNTSIEFQDAVETLFGISYTLKFMIKKGSRNIDYGVMPLEGLWWTDDMNAFSLGKKDSWKWTVMIMQPEFATDSEINEAIKQYEAKKKVTVKQKVRFEGFEESLCAQVMYIGPYVDEAPTIKKLHDFIEENGKRLKGKHHEIYLSDVRRTAPEKLKTIIRQPVE